MAMILEPLSTRPAGDQSRMTLRCQLCAITQEGTWNDLAAARWHACNSVVHGTAYVCIGCLTRSTHRRFRGRNVRREQTTITHPERPYDPRTPALEPRRAIPPRRWFRKIRSWPPSPVFEIVMVLLALLCVLLVIIVAALSLATIIEYAQRRAAPHLSEAVPSPCVPNRFPGWQALPPRSGERWRLVAAAGHAVGTGAHVQGLHPLTVPTPLAEAFPQGSDGRDTGIPCTCLPTCPPCQHPSATQALACG